MNARYQPGSSGARIFLLVSTGLFGLLVMLGGGASRIDALSQPIIWLLAILLGLSAFLARSNPLAGEARSATLFLLATAALMLVQLTPLPPALWTALPGRELYARSAEITGLAQPWRPISLTPDLGWAAFLSLLPPLAICLAWSVWPEPVRRHVLTALVALAMLSGIWGLAQVTGGSGGALRYYRVTNADSAVGFLANRNHQALLLVMAIPMLVVWARLVRVDARYKAIPKWIALGIGIFLIPLILVTNSRGGLLLLALALPAAWLLSRGERGTGYEERVYSRYDAMFRWVPALLAGLAVVIAGLTVLVRATAIDRLTATSIAEEQRSQMFPYLLDMAKGFFPLGSGFGSFDSVYRSVEPVELLTLNYMNQAHNDLLQLVIEAGLPGLLLLAMAIWWSVRRTITHWSPARRLSSARLLGRLGSVILLFLLLSSLVDYPLRTPIMAVIAVLAALWLAGDPDRASPAAARVRG